MISRRAFLASTAFACAAPISAACAQAYPTGNVRLVVPFPPGGATDVLGRVVAHDLQGLRKQNVVPEYKPGASGLIGTRQVIASPPDGYTLLLASTGAILSVAARANADAA
ncbi:MAG: Bug family tripartite tricarboxylate transporter substrate binding protein, partial [Burkholderiales bacterium]